MTTITTYRIPDEADGAPLLIVGMGVLLGFSGIVHAVTGPYETLLVGLEALISVAVASGLVYGGYWLINRRAPEPVRRRALTGVSVGVIVAAVISGWILAFARLGVGTIHGPLALLSTLVAAGGTAGFVAAVQTTPAVDGRDQFPLVLVAERPPAVPTAAPTTELGPEATAVLEALADDRSRATVAVLLSETSPGAEYSVDAIADRVADQSDEGRDAVAVSLRHATLPRLEAAGLLTWNRSADRVTAIDETAIEMGAQELGAVVASLESTRVRP